MADNSKRAHSEDLAGSEAATSVAKKTESLDDFLEAAGFVSESPKSDLDHEAAAPLREEVFAPEGYTLSDAVQLQRSLADRLGIDYVDVSALRPSGELLRILPKRLITKYRLFPVELTPTTLKVAFSDPYNVNAVTDVQLLLDDMGLSLQQCLGDEEEINQAIDRWYTAEKHEILAMIDDIAQTMASEQPNKKVKRETPGAVEKVQIGGGGGGEEEDIGALARALENVDVDANQAPLVRLVNLIFQKALKMRASDLHFEPYSDEFRIRFRVDGVLQDIESPPQKLQNAMLSRLKILAGIDLAEKRTPQDGRINMRIDGKDIDFRVSTLPAIWGESVVLRLLDKSGVSLGLEEVGFMPDNIALFQRLIRRPNGIILMTGPTGSGKTTTLYAALNTINTVDVKIITVENPVEYQIEGINQVQVHEGIGLDFATVLRTMLRQAPNVILVGEMRDLETAETGIRAALTGHLVFSTLHTNDAPGATTRLIEMGIKPYLVSSALQAIVAQRLVRRICPDCKEPYYPPPAHIEEFGLNANDYRGQPFYQGVGCHTCNYSGYRGRTAIHEIMVMSDDIRALVLKSTSSDKIRVRAREEGMRTLREDGWQKILRGETTMEEVMRVTADELA
ncbi:MAG: type II/IV secretion system protein [Candidatus Omnitrophica bacterium]|nr:Type II secretion system protein E [bacterium]NUN96090.1 type II/IV secretion system protein [Candidatus Omnitrophota bacterium]